MCVSTLFVVVLLKGSNKYLLFLDGNAEYFRKKDGSSKAQKKGVKGSLLFIIFSPE